jgi:hypothetical protein
MLIQEGNNAGSHYKPTNVQSRYRTVKVCRYFDLP